MASSDSHHTHKVFYGPVINPVSLTSHSTLPHCLLCIDVASGKIDWIIDEVDVHKLEETLKSKKVDKAHLVRLKDGEFLMPGFIDTHTHAPQFPIMGTGNQFTLLEWLNTLVFPMESEFNDKNLEFAEKAYKSVVGRVLDFGTTTCCYYGSLHLQSTKILADIAHAYGQRAFIGKCNMDTKSLPGGYDYVEPSTEESIESTLELISYIRDLSFQPGQEALVQPVLTPRFALSCSQKLLLRLGLLAASEPKLRIQTHISENEDEVVATLQRFQGAKSYAGVYDMYGLLGPNTILAHAVHLTKDEVKLIKDRGAGISHCPTSNFNLNSGIAPVGYFLDRKVKVGLGTDVSGGYSPSILNAIQNASIAAKALSFKNVKKERRHPCHPPFGSDSESHHGPGHKYDHGHDHGHKRDHDHDHNRHGKNHGHGRHPRDHDHDHDHPHDPGYEQENHDEQFANRPFKISTLLYLATAGGAAVCGIEDLVGRFEKDKSFDAILVNVGENSENPGLWGLNGMLPPPPYPTPTDPENKVNGWLERFLHGGDDRNIEKVYVQGRLVGGRKFKRA